MTDSAMCGFFFSSRRRHTRLQGDWSSDVCSSDLSRCLDDERPPGKSPGGFSFGARGNPMVAVKLPDGSVREYPDNTSVKAVAESIGKDRKSTRLNSSHLVISYAVFCLKQKTTDVVPSREAQLNRTRPAELRFSSPLPLDERHSVQMPTHRHPPSVLPAAHRAAPGGLAT